MLLQRREEFIARLPAGQHIGRQVEGINRDAVMMRRIAGRRARTKISDGSGAVETGNKWASAPRCGALAYFGRRSGNSVVDPMNETVSFSRIYVEDYYRV